MHKQVGLPAHVATGGTRSIERCCLAGLFSVVGYADLSDKGYEFSRTWTKYQKGKGEKDPQPQVEKLAAFTLYLCLYRAQALYDRLLLRGHSLPRLHTLDPPQVSLRWFIVYLPERAFSAPCVGACVQMCCRRPHGYVHGTLTDDRGNVSLSGIVSARRMAF